MVAPTGLEPVTFGFPYLKHSKYAQIEPRPPTKRISHENLETGADRTAPVYKMASLAVLVHS